MRWQKTHCWLGIFVEGCFIVLFRDQPKSYYFKGIDFLLPVSMVQCSFFFFWCAKPPLNTRGRHDFTWKEVVKDTSLFFCHKECFNYLQLLKLYLKKLYLLWYLFINSTIPGSLTAQLTVFCFSVSNTPDSAHHIVLQPW